MKTGLDVVKLAGWGRRFDSATRNYFRETKVKQLNSRAVWPIARTFCNGAVSQNWWCSMKAIQVMQLMTMVRWAPALNKATSSKFDDEFASCVETLLAAVRQEKDLLAWAYAGRVAALASIMSGQAELQIPLAAMLWEMWAERLLKLEIELVSIKTETALHAYRRLTGACVAAQRYLNAGCSQ